MKRALLLTCLLVVMCATGFAQQIPSDWDTNLPRDTAQWKYAVGVSQPSSSEQEAWKGAWRDSVQQFASSITVNFKGQTDITVQSQGFSSGIEDAYTVYMETSSFSTNVPITGVTEQARKMEMISGRYIARILAAMSAEDYDKAKQYVENEESAFIAYSHFSKKNLFKAAANQKPSGYDDYYSWLRNNCVIIAIDDPNSNAVLEQMDLFITKLYKNAAVFAHIVNGRGLRIVYNSGKYYDGILRALQNTALFTIQRENSRLVLKPVRANISGDFKTAVNAMKDSGKFVITGLETMQTQSGETVNQGAIVINQFKTIALRQFNMQAVNYAIPAQYLSGYVDEDGILRHIQNNSSAFPARYLVVCRSETKLEKGMPEYKMPPMVSASCHFTLYDIVGGETFHSGTAQTNTGAFSPANLEDKAVIEKSREVLRFLDNAKTQPNLEAIMKHVFEQL